MNSVIYYNTSTCVYIKQLNFHDFLMVFSILTAYY